MGPEEAKRRNGGGHVRMAVRVMATRDREKHASEQFGDADASESCGREESL